MKSDSIADSCPPPGHPCPVGMARVNRSGSMRRLTRSLPRVPIRNQGKSNSSLTLYRDNHWLGLVHGGVPVSMLRCFPQFSQNGISRRCVNSQLLRFSTPHACCATYPPPEIRDHTGCLVPALTAARPPPQLMIRLEADSAGLSALAPTGASAMSKLIFSWRGFGSMGPLPGLSG